MSESKSDIANELLANMVKRINERMHSNLMNEFCEGKYRIYIFNLFNYFFVHQNKCSDSDV